MIENPDNENKGLTGLELLAKGGYNIAGMGDAPKEIAPGVYDPNNPAGIVPPGTLLPGGLAPGANNAYGATPYNAPPNGAYAPPGSYNPAPNGWGRKRAG